jgi:hypothetical protein
VNKSGVGELCCRHDVKEEAIIIVCAEAVWTSTRVTCCSMRFGV